MQKHYLTRFGEKKKFISRGKVACHKSLVLFVGFLERHQSEFEALFCLNTVKISFNSYKALTAFFRRRDTRRLEALDKAEGKVFLYFWYNGLSDS